MGTHPIFESDFDCLTECRELLVPEPTLVVITTLLIPMAVITTLIVMAAHLLKVVTTNITLLHLEMAGGTTTAVVATTPVENITGEPTTDINKSNPFMLLIILLYTLPI